jgi:hypothetical protein
MYFGSSSMLPGRPRAYVVGRASLDSSVNEVCGYDFAVCRLSLSLGKSDQLGHFGTRTYHDNWEDQNYWHHTGYPGDSLIPNGLPVVIRDIAVRDDDTDSFGSLELETESDTASGMSGGPLFGFFDDGPHIIGVSSGRETEPEVNFSSFTDVHTVFAGGSPMVRLVRWAQQNWPAY